MLEYSYLKNILTDISSILPSGICRICLESEVTYFIDPCGHTICGLCKELSKSLTTCHTCRANITSLKKPLQKLGHKVKITNITSAIQAIKIVDKKLYGAADPRRKGVAIGN